MFILNNITRFHELSTDEQFEKVHKLQQRRTELKFENRKRKASKKRKGNTRKTKEEKMLELLPPELRAIFLKG